MTVYERLASTTDGQRRLAGARLRYGVLSELNHVLVKAGLTKTDLAKRVGVRKSAVGNVFNGDGNLRVNTLADYLFAAGFELELHAVPVGTPRRKASCDRPTLKLAFTDARPMESIREGGRVRSDSVRPWVGQELARTGTDA